MAALGAGGGGSNPLNQNFYVISIVVLKPKTEVRFLYRLIIGDKMNDLLIKLDSSQNFDSFEKEILKNIVKDNVKAMFILEKLLEKEEKTINELKFYTLNQIKVCTDSIFILKTRNKHIEVRIKMFKKQIPIMDSYAYKNFKNDDLEIAIIQSNIWKNQYRIEKKTLNENNERIKKYKESRSELIKYLKSIDI